MSLCVPHYISITFPRLNDDRKVSHQCLWFFKTWVGKLGLPWAESNVTSCISEKWSFHYSKMTGNGFFFSTKNIFSPTFWATKQIEDRSRPRSPVLSFREELILQVLRFGSYQRRGFRIFAMSSSLSEASICIPAAPIFLPDGPWKQVRKFSKI